MDTAAGEETKPFEGDAPQTDDWNQPDPDEELMLNQGSGRAWLVKVPKFLMDRWAALDEDDMHLATIRIYTDPAGGKPRIILFLPPNRDPANANAASSQPEASQGPSLAHPHILNWPTFEMGKTIPTQGNEPDIYELEMVSDNVDNQIIVAERNLHPVGHPQAHTSRARTTILTGRIKHEANLRPAFSTLYRKQMRERTYQVQHTPEADCKESRMLSALAAGSAFSDLVKTRPKAAKGTFERMARMPKNQLLDQLFSLFTEQPRWAIKALREKTQQPEAYLKEVLSEVASLNRSGEHNGLWELKETFKNNPAMKAEAMAGTSGDYKMEDGDDDFEDDDDEDDMEEMDIS
ncbi:transcription initiation factor IIF, beta subunit [Coprinopsis sp. MPI-PUGE-AT-0042]|nr:transcription initiation factor IIF, beta subunit [Coprinopsis sp. MPI-PUGE-AT-0042]